jgi:hypothetical protein
MAPLLLALLLLFPAHAQQQSAVPGSGPTNGTGTNTCRYANDGECDEPDRGTGACLAGSDTEDCDGENSCQFAHDGECDEPGPAYWNRTGRCDSGTDSDDCCPPHAHSSAGRMSCACNFNYRVDSSSRTCVPASPPPPPPSRRQRCDADCDEREDNAERRQQCHEDCESDLSDQAWLVAHPACYGSVVALAVATGADGVVGDCSNRTRSCTTNCQALVSRMVSDCAAGLEQANSTRTEEVLWPLLLARSVLSGIPADCIVEPVATEQPHRRADDDCSQTDNHASLLVPMVVIACVLCASAMCAAFACCKKKERTGHEKAGLLSREAHA